MKKLAIIAMVCMLFPVIILGLSCTGLSGGDIGSVSSPLAVFASEEKAYEYQYVGTEMGVPWDMAMLADGIYAYAAEKGNIEDCNALLTSLQFCILLEDELIPVIPEEPETEETEPTASPSPSPEPSASPAPEEGEEQEVEWISQKVYYYTGQEEILKYIGAKTDDFAYTDVNGFMAAINKVAEEKSTEEIMYKATLIGNPDYEDVLKNLVGLDDKNTEWVLELYDCNYLAKMYGFNYDFANIELPEIVQGEVTRQQLAEVAITLINHPYLMGGKSSQAGPPTGALDCSGYVDWVYVQCFGVGASNGSIPEGVAVSGTAQQWYASTEIEEDELKVGDLGFLRNPATMREGQVNHVGIYIGTYNGKTYWIHCGGRMYGTKDSPSGRVGISTASGFNNYNPVDDTTFNPMMASCRFRYFRRPQFAFIGD